MAQHDPRTLHRSPVFPDSAHLQSRRRQGHGHVPHNDTPATFHESPGIGLFLRKGAHSRRILLVVLPERMKRILAGSEPGRDIVPARVRSNFPFQTSPADTNLATEPSFPQPACHRSAPPDPRSCRQRPAAQGAATPARQTKFGDCRDSFRARWDLSSPRNVHRNFGANRGNPDARLPPQVHAIQIARIKPLPDQRPSIRPDPAQHIIHRIRLGRPPKLRNLRNVSRRQGHSLDRLPRAQRRMQIQRSAIRGPHRISPRRHIQRAPTLRRHIEQPRPSADPTTAPRYTARQATTAG